MIVDFRIRPPAHGFLTTLMFKDSKRRDHFTAGLGMPAATSAQARSLDLLLAEMDAAGVAQGVVPGRNSGFFGSVSDADIAALMADHPGRFLGLCSIEPSDRHAAIASIDRAMAQGFSGVNIEPGAYAQPLYPDDHRLYPVYAHCENKGIPIVLMAGGNAGPDLSYSDPIRVDRMAADFPDLRIALSHGGWPWVAQVLHIAYRRPNVYVSADMYLCNMPGMRDYIDAANGFLQDRFLYASNYPFNCVRAYAEWFGSIGIDPTVMDKIRYRNARRFLNLEADEPD